MKIFAFAALVSISITAVCQQERPFTINGYIKGKIEPVQKVYLYYSIYGPNGDIVDIQDSSMVKNGTYSFKGKIVEPIWAQLIPKPASATGTDGASGMDRALLCLSPNNIEITSTDSFSNVVIKGSVANDEYTKLNKSLKSVTDRQNKLSQQYEEFDKAKDLAGKKKVMTEFMALEKESKEIYRKYLQENPNSPIAMWVINYFAGQDIDVREVEQVFAALPASFKAYPSYKDFKRRMEIARKTSIGNQAIDFTQNDTTGRPFTLSSLRGKYVLIDFWASWCGPCRAENPNVVGVFNTYKDKGFTVLGVSLDNKSEKWLKAIHEDRLTWTHVSDLKKFNNSVAKAYGISSIPYNVLVDENGKIIAKNLKGEGLQNKLAEIFDK